jgi:YVTN family beta-propeller protein
VCVGSDQLVEISTERLRVRRRMDLAPGREGPLAAAGEPALGPAGTAMGRDGAGGAAACGPTWVIPSHDDARLYVACNRSDEVLEIDAGTLAVTRRFRGGKAPYNLAGTSDGRLLLATNKGDASVSVFDLDTGAEAARVEASRPVTHGVVVSPDDRYAFVSNEAVGATRGTVDVIDLERLERVASVEAHHQPGGIDFWKMEAAAR